MQPCCLLKRQLLPSTPTEHIFHAINQDSCGMPQLCWLMALVPLLSQAKMQSGGLELKPGLHGLDKDRACSGAVLAANPQDHHSHGQKSEVVAAAPRVDLRSPWRQAHPLVPLQHPIRAKYSVGPDPLGCCHSHK